MIWRIKGNINSSAFFGRKQKIISAILSLVICVSVLLFFTSENLPIPEEDVSALPLVVQNENQSLGFGFYNAIKLNGVCDATIYFNEKSSLDINSFITDISFKYVNGEIQPDILSKLTFSEARIGDMTISGNHLKQIVHDINHFSILDFTSLQHIGTWISILESQTVSIIDISEVGSAYVKLHDTNSCNRTIELDAESSSIDEDFRLAKIQQLEGELRRSWIGALMLNLKAISNENSIIQKGYYKVSQGPLLLSGALMLVLMLFSKSVAFVAMYSLNSMYFFLNQGSLSALASLFFVTLGVIICSYLSKRQNISIIMVSIILCAILTEFFFSHYSFVSFALNSLAITSIYCFLISFWGQSDERNI
ncbi:MFS transporter [Candidatus Puniceispirillum marinum]|uniref:Uncharacterized protein n=1 Tax=Puniceispirillum marinum (strain IMCC1322) TaxID=488538 RepID=D5BSJ1_PUNMI|nr:hypothetical protein [Candidatus Puniceispirillum marinum]ADE39238.1 hypothetical protein SAR116_0995 [Candidatus Puniceispirillum marinum IMCC1322]